VKHIVFFAPWTVTSTLIFLLPLVRSPLLPSRIFCVLYFICVCFSIPVISLLADTESNFLLVLVVGIIFVLLNLYKTQTEYMHWLIFILMSLCVIAALSLKNTSETSIILYASSIACGFLIALFIISLRNLFYARQLKLRLNDYMTDLQYLLNAIFDCFLQVDYPKAMYLYEKRIHDAKKPSHLKGRKLGNVHCQKNGMPIQIN